MMDRKLRWFLNGAILVGGLAELITLLHWLSL